MGQPEATERDSAPETGPERVCLCGGTSGRIGTRECLPVYCSSRTLSVFWILLCICSEKETEDSREG